MLTQANAILKAEVYRHFKEKDITVLWTAVVCMFVLKYMKVIFMFNQRNTLEVLLYAYYFSIIIIIIIIMNAPCS